MLSFLYIGLSFFLPDTTSSLKDLPEEAYHYFMAETPESEEDVDWSEYLENLDDFISRPININAATTGQLQQLYFLSDLQIENLLRYRQDYGAITTVSDLLYIHGFDERNVALLAHFITFGPIPEPKLTWQNIHRYGKSQLLCRYGRDLSQKKGYRKLPDSILYATDHAAYLGSPMALMFKYQFAYKDRLKFGFVADKDPGEIFFKGQNKQGFDFYSAYLSIKRVGHMQQLVLGRYQLQFGQGLALWLGTSMNSLSTPSGWKKSPVGVKPFTSSAEYGFLQGVATTWRWGAFDITSFISFQALDANIASKDEQGEVTAISSLLHTGYHRTLGECAKKQVAKEYMAGVHIDYRNAFARLGATFYNETFLTDVMPNVKPYNQFALLMKHNMIGSVDYEAFYRKIRCYGEVAYRGYQGVATVHGLSIIPEQRVALNLLYRYYSRSFYNIYSSAFTGGQANNENGLALAINTEWSAKWKSILGIDMYAKPWLSYRVDAPMEGRRYHVQFNYRYSSKWNLAMRYQYDEKALNEQVEQGLHPVSSTWKHHGQCLLTWMPANGLTLKSRVDYLSYTQQSRELGFLLSQDINYQFEQLPCALSLRYALFDTDGYDSRIYVYESDVLYAFSSKAYQQRGKRIYLILRYECAKQLTLWLRYGQFFYGDRQTIGSDLEEIQGNTQQEIKIQLRYKF